MKELMEKLANIEHQRWVDWQKYMHSKCQLNPDTSLTIPAELVLQWERQIATNYSDLSEAEKESDRDQVKRYWPLIEDMQGVVDAMGKTATLMREMGTHSGQTISTGWVLHMAEAALAKLKS